MRPYAATLAASAAATLIAMAPAFAQQAPFTKADFAKEFCEILKVKPVDGGSYFEDVKPDANTKYINAMGFAFPASHWDGKHWQAKPNATVVTEMVLKSFVIYRGFPLLDAESSGALIAKQLPNYAALGYSPEMKVYVGTLLRLGLDKGSFTKNASVSKQEAQRMLGQLATKFPRNASTKVSASSPTTISNRTIEVNQEYYQDGPVENQFRVYAKIRDDNYLHQFASIKASTELYTKNTAYGIGTWSNAESYVAGAKMVGSFLTVSGHGEGAKSQLVGQEIDVINRLTPAEANKYSSVGVQIVTIGTADSTAAIEFVSDHSSKWRHGLMFDEGSIASDGTLIGVAPNNPMRLGLDFGNTDFKDSAIRLKNKAVVRFEPKDYKGNAATIFQDESNFLTLTNGQGGIVIKSNDWKKNIVVVNNNGDVTLEQGSLILRSPNGTKFKVGVDDSGKLSTAKVK